MATSLSEGEFHRMQLQLIELRTVNYELEAKNKKLERDLSEIQEKHELLHRELGKAKQAINKSKKAKDAEALIQETDSLQRKLQSQEEEFRLQNQTLMAELALLIASNEDLKKEAESRKEQSNATKGEENEQSDNTDELRRLQAENSALQKKLNVLQEKLERDVPVQNEPLSQKSSSETPQHEGNRFFNISELQLQLDTEREEKLIIKAELEQKQKESKEQEAALQEELDKTNEKLKKKQESFLQLQAEKEELFKESSSKLEESQAARDRDQKYYKDQIAKLQAEIERGKKEAGEQQMTAEKQMDDLRQQLTELKKQVDVSGMATTHQLQEQASRYLADIAILRDTVQKLTKDRDDLSAQLQESSRVAEDAVAQMQAAQTERDTQITAVQEISKVAEKRKALLDELAIKYQKEYDSHKESIKQMETRHMEEVDRLQSVVHDHVRKISELSKQLPVIDELSRKVHSLEDTKGWLERRLKEIEEQLSSTTSAYKQERELLMNTHKTEVEELTSNHKQEISRLKEEKEVIEQQAERREAELNEELAALRSKANNLKQEIKDTEDEKKLHEKKGMTMLKDLKRQLHAERKRAERLQAKLQELLSEGNSKMEDLFRTPDSDIQAGDASSVSSWGASASGLGRDSIASGPQSPMSGNSGFVSEANTGEEHGDLLKRIGILQQEKWALEEKVNHLEVSNACMAEDILNKTSIIEHYVMESRTGPKHQSSHEEKLSLKKVMDLVNRGSDHAQQTQDMNKKLQAMLEETLTKNMHLQQHLELMSQEVVRLSKLSAPAIARAPPDRSAKEATPPTSLPLAATTAASLPSQIPNNDSSSDRDSSVASEENFEVISNLPVNDDPVIIDGDNIDFQS
ncbi:unnamed protein product [Candidula unifasciata]|uniref:GRIP1-associated protein 1 n=1 Tax=Candidula unifasciata TaxID=100452 RepID=A0A8S3Z5E2_9EUPU|nr:unnamed protein product [Candidula unifasciata]